MLIKVRAYSLFVLFFSLMSIAWAEEKAELVVPVVVHGGKGLIDPSFMLPEGDHFLLPEPNRMLVTATQKSGLQVFATSARAFAPLDHLTSSSQLVYESIFDPAPRRGGADFEGTPHYTPLNIEGFTLSNPNSQAVAESCSDHYWDVNLRVATTCKGGAEKLEAVRIFLKDQSGGEVVGGELLKLSLFGFASDQLSTGLYVNIFDGAGDVFAGDLRARASSQKFTGNVIDFLPLSTAKGRVSPYITLSLSKHWMQGCYRIAAEVIRGNEQDCQTSLLIDDFVAIREGNEQRGQLGLIEGVSLSYPQGRDVHGSSCPRTCAADGTATACKAVRFESTQHYLLNLPKHNSVIYAGSSFGENGVTSLTVDKEKKEFDKIRSAYLQSNPYSAFHQLNRQYITSELSIVDNAGGSLMGVGSIGIFACPLRIYQCLGALKNEAGVSNDLPAFYLNNGVAISSDTTVGVLFNQVKDVFKRSKENLENQAISEKERAQRQRLIELDMQNLTRLLEELNKTGSASSTCKPIEPKLALTAS